MDPNDIVELQWLAARYAHERMTYAADKVNAITARMIDAGIVPQTDPIRGDVPTVWVRDGSFGWPKPLIEKYGWDGRKKAAEAAKALEDK